MFNAPNGKRYKAPVFIAAFFMMVVSAEPRQAQAGHYQMAPEEPREGLTGPQDPVTCPAYLQNLKKFEHLPYGMACRRELDPALGFTRPTWKKLDIATYMDLVKAIFWYRPGLPTKQDPPRLSEARIKELLKEENYTLEVTRLDLMGDGKLHNLVRFGPDKTCDPKLEMDHHPATANRHRSFYVVDDKFKNIDVYTGFGITTLVDDVFLYKGRVYSDRFWGRSFREIEADGVLGLSVFSQFGAGRICEYLYSK